MGQRLLIRLAAPADFPTVRALVRDAGLPLDGFDEASSVFVAERDGAVLGVAGLEDHVDGTGRAMLLRSVAVHAEARGSGIGTALVHAALRTAEQHGSSVSLLTETAGEYFPRFGFDMVDRDALPSALTKSKELQGACPATARALTRLPTLPSAVP